MQALFFDCDGVIADSERECHRIAFNQAFAELELDVHWSVEDYGELLHIAGGRERIEYFFNRDGWPAEAVDQAAFLTQLHRRKNHFVLQLINAGKLTLRPGIARLIEEAQAEKITVAVCSTSQQPTVDAIVKNLLGAQRSERIHVYAGDIVERKKPDPAIYLLAARSLQLQPEQCMVIEDSAIGLQAALQAGMQCLITTSTYTQAEDFNGATCVVTDLDSGKPRIDVAQCRNWIAQSAARF